MSTTKTKYTGDTIPASLANVTLEITGEMETHDGVAFNALVRAGGKVVGTIENEGRGGGTWFHHHDLVARTWWEEAVKEFEPILKEEEGDIGFAPNAEEWLADRLYEDAALRKELDRKRSLLMRVNGDNDRIIIFKTKPAEVLPHPIKRAAIANAHSKVGDIVEFWIKGKGWEAAV